MIRGNVEEEGTGKTVLQLVDTKAFVTMFPQPAERARAVGIFAFVASAGGAIGLLAGGLITQTISWHWIFFINLPIGLVAIYLGSRLIERTRVSACIRAPTWSARSWSPRR